MRYVLKPLHCRPWLLQGLSPKLIESHYENNYVRLDALRRLSKGGAARAGLNDLRG